MGLIVDVGLIVDTCVLIDAEQKKRSVRATVELGFKQTKQLDLAVSAITLVELAYGVALSREASARALRDRFISDIRSQIPIYAETDEIAVQAGLLDGGLKSHGASVEWDDLLIGVTALHHGHGVSTRNVRHSEAVSGPNGVEL